MSSNKVEDYGWTANGSPHSCAYIAPAILSTLKVLKARRVLDLGSGDGSLCELMQANGYEVVGVEYDKKGIEIARSRCRHVPFYNFSVDDDPAELLAKETEFDAVISTEVIEHLYAPHSLVRYAGKVLKPDGRLIITTPYHGYLKNLVLSVFDAWDRHHTPLWHGGHIKFWSRATLSQLLSNNGLRIESFSGVGRFPYLWKSMLVTAEKTQRA